MGRAKTLDELHEKYGFKEITVVDGKMTLNPVYKKHMDKTWEIQNVYALLGNDEVSLGKARELTAAIIESAQTVRPPLDRVLIGKEIEVDGNKFTPIVELCKSQLRRIYGNFEDEFKLDQVLIKDEDSDSPEEFGVIAYYFDTRVGFTLNLKDDWKEFQLSCGEGSNMMINQLEMFDQLRAWGFSI